MQLRTDTQKLEFSNWIKFGITLYMYCVNSSGSRSCVAQLRHCTQARSGMSSGPTEQSLTELWANFFFWDLTSFMLMMRLFRRIKLFLKFLWLVFPSFPLRKSYNYLLDFHVSFLQKSDKSEQEQLFLKRDH